MAGNALEKEMRLQQAIAAFNAAEVPAIGKQRKFNKISKQHLQRLTRWTPKEEDAVVKCVYQLDAWGWPMTISEIEVLATEILRAKGDTKPLGKNWICNFLERHKELKATENAFRSSNASRQTATLSHLIFKECRIQHSWIPEDIDDEIVIRVSPNGWTSTEIALEWLQHFDKHTAPRTRGSHRLLILDGHASHLSLEFVQYCVDHHIVALCLPPTQRMRSSLWTSESSGPSL
ncbi:hypothetical protein VTN31DRAFT_7380 [Thermomyces dupontii]|uniref:uncharacterized protein n=1 Tax=Talaromyces thermophilus TaxID=28565 RepID=UPI00374368D2